MRRQKTKIIILVIVLAVLTAAVVLMRVPAQSGQTDTDVRTAEDGQTRMLVGFDSEDFTAESGKVSVENGEESYTIEMMEGACEIADFPENRLDRGKLNLAVEKLMQAEVEEDLGAQEDLIQFGLGKDAPEFTISGTARTTTERTASDQMPLDQTSSEQTALEQVSPDRMTQSFRIGNMLPDRVDERYALCGGSVCIVRGFPQELCEGRKAFYKLNLIAIAPLADADGENADGENADRLEYLRLSGSHFENEISIVPDVRTSSGYLMEEPVYGEAMFASTDATTGTVSILDSLAYVEASAMAYENADADTIRECGLEKPYALAAYSLNGEEHVLKVSGMQDGMRYLMVDEDPFVYRVEDIRVNAWAEAKASDLRTSYIWLVDVTKLDALVLTGENGTYEYRIMIEEGDNGHNFRVYCEDKELDAEGIWLPFYQKLLGMTILNTERPSGWEEEPAYTVSYIYGEQENEEPVTIEFHREHDRERYAAILNGRFAGILRADTVEEAMELADKVNADGESR